MLSVVMLNVVMLSVIMLNVVAPLPAPSNEAWPYTDMLNYMEWCGLVTFLVVIISFDDRIIDFVTVDLSTQLLVPLICCCLNCWQLIAALCINLVQLYRNIMQLAVLLITGSSCWQLRQKVDRHQKAVTDFAVFKSWHDSYWSVTFTLTNALAYFGSAVQCLNSKTQYEIMNFKMYFIGFNYKN